MEETKLISMTEALDIISRIESVSRASALEKFEELAKIKGGLDEALKEIMNSEREYWLGKHKYKITYNQREDRWRTYLPPNFKSVAKRKRKDLENLIIEFYKNQEAEQQKPDTLNKLYPRFLAYKESETSINNARRINITWNRYLKGEPMLDVKLDEMTVPDMTVWYLELIEKHKLHRKRFSDIKSIINMMFTYAIGQGITKFNISKAVTISYKKLYKKDAKPVDEQVYVGDERSDLVKLALDKYRETKNMSYLAVVFNVFIGLRVGELVALTVEDVSGNFVHVKAQELENIEKTGDFKYHRNGYIISSYTKTVKSERYVPLSDKAKEVRGYILAERESRGVDSEYLFLSKDGERLHAPQVESVMYKHLNPIMGTPQKSNHSLRKGFLSELHNSKQFSDAEIMQWSGHTQISTLQNCYLFPTQPVEEKMDTFKSVLDDDMPELF